MAWAAIARFLIKIALAVLADVIRRIIMETDFVKRLIEELKKIIDDITTIWSGQTSEQFLADLRSEIEPELEKLLTALVGGSSIVNRIEAARDDIDGADKRATTQASDLRKAFKKVKV